MKKSTKFFCGFSFFCIILGLILCGIALGFGANFNQLSNIFSESKILSFFYRNNNSDLDKDALIWENSETSFENYYILEIAGKDNPIKSLDINIESCKLVIIPGDSLQVRASNLLENNLTCKISKGGTFTIKDSASFGLFNIFTRKNYSENGIIEITLPKNFSFNKINLYTNKGNISILENFFTCEELNIENSNGKITLENVNSQSSKISTNYGETILSGSFYNDTKLDCASGKIDFYIENDFSYFVEEGFGNVNINGKNLSNSTSKISTSKKQNNIKVNCKLGYVQITSK